MTPLIELERESAPIVYDATRPEPRATLWWAGPYEAAENERRRAAQYRIVCEWIGVAGVAVAALGLGAFAAAVWWVHR